jgi:hypothetical protein
LRRVGLALALSAVSLLVVTVVGWQFAVLQYQSRDVVGLYAGRVPEDEPPSTPPAKALPAPPTLRPDKSIRLQTQPFMHQGNKSRPDKPSLLEMQLAHYDGDTEAYLGDIGLTSTSARVDDLLRINVRLSGPAYCYLLEFNPGGKGQLCQPHDPKLPPEPRQEFKYPAHDESLFCLSDGDGGQAFVLLLSGAPLPSYEQWQSRAGIAPWKKFVADGIWQYDNGEFTPLPKQRGTERPRRGPRLAVPEGLALFGATPGTGLTGLPWATWYGGPPKPLIDLCNYYRNRPGIDAVHVIAFPVKPKAPR